MHVDAVHEKIGNESSDDDNQSNQDDFRLSQTYDLVGVNDDEVPAEGKASQVMSVKQPADCDPNPDQVSAESPAYYASPKQNTSPDVVLDTENEQSDQLAVPIVSVQKPGADSSAIIPL